MTQRLIALFIALATALSYAPAAAAQVSGGGRDWSALRALAPGTKLAVNMQTGEGVEGELVNVSETALTLSRKDAPVELERGRIRKVYRVGGRSAGKAALVGLGLGAGAGAAVGAGVAGGGTHESGEAGLPVLLFGAGGAVVGAVTGLVARLSGRKREIVYEAE
ncbi:MAG TPA: hypothetical protein VN282_14225 [Pyrinomonadaceae bacterium]|nr:hypothetical protein [Pyrinomonadaceae bacterium]